jgi:DNA-binding transcriptional ArsR family regulator
MGEKILLDSEVFKALASETRLEILKNLDERKKTVTELSRIMDLNKATIYEHLSILNHVGLVTKVESLNKWVYYRLTWKGTDLLHPEKKKIAIVFSAAIMFLIMGMIYLIGYMREAADNYVTFENEKTFDDAMELVRDNHEAFSIFQGLDTPSLVFGIIMFFLFCVTIIFGIWIWKTSSASPIFEKLQ